MGDVETAELMARLDAMMKLAEYMSQTSLELVRDISNLRARLQLDDQMMLFDDKT